VKNNHKCRACGSASLVKNGFRRQKQCRKCKDCGFQSVDFPTKKVISPEMRKYIEKALLERNSLRSICRIFGVSLTWLLSFAVSVWKSAPEDLGVKIKNLTSENLDFELDELCTFVGRKKQKRGFGLF
jgi:hypothetical protein